ncbi:sigma-70 family RNA polymerase sigma factor [Virgibacillus halophilus]|uniref:Sigma-70 family RNA polymerase sigma factor n=1 Tax=Tigheibacillus halophilus TaxID=361280 RepID=A0ABU5C990_9BACI|nr:sigma-70 family RNA polymerase sigma factor [Virgibacillus halophilus]
MDNEKQKQHVSFEEIYEQNKRRIYYQIHKMNISDPYHDFFQEGLCALWNAYETYNPDKGTMATYFNYTIRNRLIDKIRKDSRMKEKEQIIIAENKKRL